MQVVLMIRKEHSYANFNTALNSNTIPGHSYHYSPEFVVTVNFHLNRSICKALDYYEDRQRYEP